jgi:hypothetical protein
VRPNVTISIGGVGIALVIAGALLVNGEWEIGLVFLALGAGFFLLSLLFGGNR